MSFEYVELGECCDDCALVIATGDYCEIHPERERDVRAGLARVGQSLIVQDDRGFSWLPCAICGGLAGFRHLVGYLGEPSNWSLRRVKLNAGGYDVLGCYWGSGAPLWEADNENAEHAMQFRAVSRLDAKCEVWRSHPLAKFYR